MSKGAADWASAEFMGHLGEIEDGCFRERVGRLMLLIRGDLDVNGVSLGGHRMVVV